MKNVTDSFFYLVHWSPSGNFGLNTDILSTNIINITVVVGVLIFFGQRVLSDFLENRKNRILKTLKISEELRVGAVEKREKARARLCKVQMEAEEFRVNGYSEIERKKCNLMSSTYNILEEFEKNKNETLRFQQQRAIHHVRQRFLEQALQRALETLKSCLNNEFHLRTIRTNIGILGTMKEITD
uniref:ATP synthase CF0 subunit I n=1 Tax=Cuscuta africana TaxID=413235 RepID=A0A7H0DGN9_9ASTE|nr:ATP synthase CF0 subunit I [Cuscuta africana]QNP08499.1 ATP synthase CF0 subunit I [Cuscuta africana]